MTERVATAGPSAAPMSAARWSRVQDLFGAALECSAPQRDAWLDHECGDDLELRKEVQSLLVSHERGGLIDGLAGQMSAPSLWRSRIDALEWSGKRVAQYSVLEQLGAGGMGFVYKARDERLNRHVALKFLPPHLCTRADAKQRFLTEARAAAQLDHVNICTIHEIGETPDGQLFIAMPLYAGETLQERLERTPQLSFSEAASIALQIANGLALAHEHGVVHRDVKPSNVMLLPDGCVKVLDFGIARVADASIATRDGATFGTIAYMSPEQTNAEPVDARSDVWSLGVVLYEMVAGERPFRGDSAHALSCSVLDEDPQPIAARRAGAPTEIDTLLGAALAKPPEQRFATMKHMAAALTALVEVCSPEVRNPGSVHDNDRSPAGERRRSAVLVCLVSNYAGLVENLPPQRLEDLMTQIRSLAVEVVRMHGGLVNHTLGEEIVALFGVPFAHEDDDLRAVRAALELNARIAQLGRSLAAELSAPVMLQAGVHAGVIVARRLNAGPQRYEVTGRAVQIAARLAALASGADVLISSECKRLLDPFIQAEPRESFVLGTEATPITPWRLVGASGLQTRLEAAVRKGLTPLAGRGAELATIESHFSQARLGRGQVVLVIGEAGVGKSRLLYEMRERIRATQVRVLQARCRSYGGAAPYLPFIEMLRDALGLQVPGGDLSAGELIGRIRTIDPALEQFAPLYLHLLSVPSNAHSLPRHLRGDHLRESMPEALAAILIALARSGPTVFLLEDWHWSDEGSSATLQRLMEIVASQPILIVATSRPEGLERIDWASRSACMQVTPLDFDASAAVMKDVLGVRRIDEALVKRVYQRTGGNPFFIEEVCSTLVEQGSIAARNGEGVAAADIATLHIPDTVQAVIRTRLDSLDSRSLEVLRVAAVIGREFTLGLLIDAVGERTQTLQALERLRTAGLIQQTSVTPEIAWRFKHALTQEVTYDSLLSRQRRALHAEVGGALERLESQRADEHAEMLAYHFAGAEDWPRAVRYGRRAAERASALSQFADALAMLDRVQECLAKLPQGDERFDIFVEVLLQQERLCETLGMRSRQQQIVAELISLLAPRGSSPPLTLAYLRQGDLSTLLKRFDAADRALSTALRMSRERGDAELERHALRSIGLLRWHEERHEEALAITQSALAIDRERRDELAVAGDLANLGVIFRSMGDHVRARACLEEAMSSPALVHDPTMLVYSLQNLANVHRGLGDLDRALEHLQRANEISRKHLLPIQRSFHLMSIAHVLLQQDRVTESLQVYQESIDLSRRARHADGLVQSLRALGEVLFGLGRDRDALPHLSEAATLFAQLEDSAGEVDMLGRVATLLERSGESAEAVSTWVRVRDLRADLGDAAGELDALEGVARAIRKTNASPTEVIAHVAAALALAATLGASPREAALRNTLGILEWERGDYAAALRHYETALALARQLGDRQFEGLVLNSLGLTLARLERYEEARTALEESVQLNRRTGAQLLEAHALAALADVRLARNDRSEACAHLQQALTLRRALGDVAGEQHLLQRLAEVTHRK